jgi:DNA polymerase-1
MKKEKKEALDNKEFTVRRAIIPAPFNFFGMIDYDQVEYRLLINYANPRALIRKIKGGLDVHAAMADMSGLHRDQAKNANFANLYGSGIDNLANMMDCTVKEAGKIVSSIEDVAPEIPAWAKRVKRTVRDRGHIYTWAGRRIDFPVMYDQERKQNTRYEYRAVNALIQGGCADLLKMAMVKIDEYITDSQCATQMKLTIHDELVFEGPRGEEWVLEKFREIMENVYPAKFLGLTAGIDISYTSLADKEPYDGFSGKDTATHTEYGR